MSFFDPSAAPTPTSFIGVPEGYSAFYPRDPNLAGPPAPRMPQYEQGDQYRPASYSTDAVYALQQQLEDAGLLKSYAPGTWDSNSISAYTTVLGIANAAGLRAGDILARLIYVGGIKKQDGTAGGGGGGGGGLGAAQITDDDIRALADKVAKGVLGRSLREDEVSGFIPAFRSSLAGGTSAQVAGENVIRQQIAPAEAGGYGIGNAMQAIDQMLSGGSTQMVGK